MTISLTERVIVEAAQKGMDEFVEVFRSAILEGIGGRLDEGTMGLLNADQITLLAYCVFRDEVMDGGHVQLIHNGYGRFIFLNPFAKAMRLWGAKPFSKLVYRGREFYEECGAEIERECSDEEFMALFERYPVADGLDEEFMEMEEEVTALVAEYIDNHIENFAVVVK